MANKNLTQLVFSFLDEEISLIKKIFKPQQFEYQFIEQFEQHKKHLIEEKIKRLFNGLGDSDKNLVYQILEQERQNAR